MATRLAEAGVDRPDLDARVLMAEALRLDPTEIVTDGQASVDAADVARIEALLARRLAGEPVARILGRREFWSLSFDLSPETLVPRPDTETVVAVALDLMAGLSAPRILDLGTGTGAILAALLSERPDGYGIAVDFSPAAARTARDNLARLGLADRSAVMVGDWAEALKARFDLIVSNPPYIPGADIGTLDLDVRAHDPRAALDGGPDGLDAYRRILVALPGLLKPRGSAVLELGIGQEADVAALARAAGLDIPGPARRDLGGIPRALALRAPAGVAAPQM
ncbi:peptide chain release factor N(5)-glutamine methyltransferase [Aquabacter sp. L1I39]|uniref:peptide chain release factor N(5)-glutamine methyltransferase n=1 Tax=Aquabacter sp. L1I39 TaxID=2820278 RepID=UPI001AD9891D|nr:peptide chain release factor N(5)-glutamine methyltransferase [Aquabacter sp. L1I39]QTL06253.1 peptide chain release factor N(5)-glutamine methyltransferase [Aquabacter sp. L1I39]